MMFDDKKKAANVILSRMKKDGSESHSEMKPEAQVDHAFQGLHAAAEDMINAIHSKSPDDLHKSLRSFLEQHQDMGNEGSKDESPDNKPASNEKAKEGNPQF